MYNRTITIREDKSGMWYATSEDEPPIFVATTSQQACYKVLNAALLAEIIMEGEV